MKSIPTPQLSSASVLLDASAIEASLHEASSRGRRGTCADEPSSSSTWLSSRAMGSFSEDERAGLGPSISFPFPFQLSVLTCPIAILYRMHLG